MIKLVEYKPLPKKIRDSLYAFNELRPWFIGKTLAEGPKPIVSELYQDKKK